MIEDVTDRLGCLGLWGLNAREVLQAVSATDVSNLAFPYMTARTVEIKGRDGLGPAGLAMR